ncbi:MAG TPA: SRPBCC domain-containing protein [Pyrinomonadaceae bacterium]|nr:SRPBCC domain-containing protein [Pyrinomonadaceae bacterium]
MSSVEIRPIKRSISVSSSPEKAFRRFTEEFGSWWPSQTHSIGCDRLKQVVFEQHEGGRIYEEHVDGRRFQWGRVTLWEPPTRVRFTWHPSRDPSTAQDVEIEFKAEGAGTRVELTSTGWERWGRRAKRARKGYDLGWGYVLNVWAGRRTAGMAMIEAVGALLIIVMKLRGGREAEIARAGGEMQ